mmetsp:Transcript_26236/g.44265  ORF Transcript_26236/g.44265 Transcript_26236/m.44265 type:complete len:177 (+) Transcript_26236:700-1230(+)
MLLLLLLVVVIVVLVVLRRAWLRTTITALQSHQQVMYMERVRALPAATWIKLQPLPQPLRWMPPVPQQQEEDGEVAAIRDKAMSQLHPTVAAQVSSVLQQRRLAASRGVASSIEAAVASATMSASLTLPPSSSKYGPVPGSFGGSTADFFFLDSATSSTHTNSNNNNNKRRERRCE